MVRIDYEKPDDMIRQTWIIERLKMYKIFDKLINFITKAMEKLKVELIAGGQILAKAKIQRIIFQGDLISQLLYFTAMMPLNCILRKLTGCFKFTKSKKRMIR